LKKPAIASIHLNVRLSPLDTPSRITRLYQRSEMCWASSASKFCRSVTVCFVRAYPFLARSCHQAVIVRAASAAVSRFDPVKICKLRAKSSGFPSFRCIPAFFVLTTRLSILGRCCVIWPMLR
jgi:hypothetical protein